MKRIKNLILATIITSGLLTGCGKASGSNLDADFTIGVNQLMEHPALDDARRGFEDELSDLGLNVNIKYQNAQGDIPNTISISQKFISDKVDLILAIGTPAAQSTKQLNGDIPVLFTAVTDPVDAGLVKSLDSVQSNMTGTSDMANVRNQLELFHKLDESIGKVGVVYNLNETNSKVQLEEVKKVAPDFNLEVFDVGVKSINEVQQSLDYMISNVDAVYILSDNMIASSAGLVSKKLIQNKMISISAEESQVSSGILLTNGLSYYELGRQTGAMAKKILVDKIPVDNIPVEKSDNTKLKFNSDTLKSLGLDPDNEVFKNGIDIK